MTDKEKYQKCLNFIKSLYRLKFDTLVSIEEGVYNNIMSKEAENFLKEIDEFEDNKW